MDPRTRGTLSLSCLILLLVALFSWVQTPDAEAKPKPPGTSGKAASKEGKKGKKGKSGKDKDVPAAVYETVGRTKPRDPGDIDPTTVPIVDDDLLFAVAPAHDPIRARAAHAHATGAGRIVAVLDGGFDLDHPVIAPHVLPYGFDAIDGDDDPTDLGDGVDNDHDGIIDRARGHGTFVIGMILRAAPGVMILPVRVRDDEGWGTDDETLAGLDYALAMGADVVNLSGSCHKGNDRRIQDRIKRLEAAGVTVLVAAGNDGADRTNKLGAKSRCLAVGAVDERDQLASWSNCEEDDAGQLGVVCAPGVDLWGPFGSQPDASYVLWSGTSFAVGFVSGAAAAVMEARPELRPKEIYEHLRATCDPAFDRDGMPLAFGGRINLLRAVAP